MPIDQEQADKIRLLAAQLEIARNAATVWERTAREVAKEAQRFAVHTLRQEGHHVAAGVLHVKLGL